ncbi:MAG: barstar family protein [Veillonella parvula]|jgi:barstar (barnase inhibitor)|uniref:barstar family protein n=1 Tax=Veillonella parvula TaxID=29466 RepID=UPI0028FE3EF8|nr:barstar family protein [Veillonella parvula]MDU2140897.1 barstar family protein [Veillonella parvula]
MEKINQVDTENAISRQVFTIDGRRFSNMKGFYQEVKAVFTDGLDWHIGDNLDAFNDVLRGGFGRHEYGEPIHIRWISYDKSIRNLEKETMDEIEDIILDTDNSGHDCTLEKL